MTRRLWLIPCALAMSTGASLPQVEGAQPMWIDFFGTAATDWNNRFIELSDGNLMAGGYVGRDDARPLQSDWSLLLRKYRANGELVWERQLERPGLDAGWAVRELAGGEVAVAGFSDSGGSGGQDMHLAVFSRRGDLQWEQWYGGAKDDRATDLLVMRGGGFLLVGQTESEGAGERDVFVVRTDAKGHELWRKTYGTAQVDRGFFAALAPDGSVAIAGATGVQGNYDYLLMKIDRDGRLIWRRTVRGEANDANHGVVVRGDGTIVFVGYGPSWGGRNNDVSVLRFGPNGELLSHELIGGPGDDRVQFAAVASTGAVWLTGYTKSFSADWRILIARVAPNGELERWMGAIGGPADLNGSTVAEAKNGDLLLGGYGRRAPGELPDAVATRINPEQVLHRKENVVVRNVQMRCIGPAADQLCQ